MKWQAFTLALTASCAIGVAAQGQVAVQGTPDSHVAAARALAGQDLIGLFDRICPAPAPQRGAAAAPAPARSGPPPIAEWHAEPVKVFDNLYFLGQTEYSVWAVTTSAGIILVDTIYDYSVEDEVVGGLKKLGLDPATIKYAIVSHGHGDHSGGAKYLQDRFGTRIILSEADWDLLDRSTGTRPKRDMVATDGQKLTLGDTTLTMYLTPGHTAGTISTLIPVKDHGLSHTAAVWGGTAFNWLTNRTAYITADRPDSYWFNSYITSARRFKHIATRAGVDIILSNHTAFDGSKAKLPAVLTLKTGELNPYVVGIEGVRRYLTIADECAQAGRLRVQPPAPAGRGAAAPPAPAQGGGFGQLPPPLVKENVTAKLGPHSYVIPDGSATLVPNVGIVVGSRATLVVDTGMGPRNGAAVMREVAKVSKNSELYLVTTHFHAEHVAGISAFPAGTKFVISRVQQQDLDELGPEVTQRFASGSPAMAELLKDAPVRRADALFDRDYRIDLGGVAVRLLALGPTHTRGDTMVFVEGDNVLYAGDVVMNHAPVAFGATSSAKAWVGALTEIDALHPATIVPAHGPVGPGSLVADQRGFFDWVRTRVGELKGRGQPVDDVVKTVTAEFPMKYPGWTAANRVGAIARGIYAE